MSRNRRPGPLGKIKNRLMDFWHRRSFQIWGVFWLGLGTALAISLVSYAPDDPSLNTASVGPVANALGIAGAYIADFTLQIFGILAWPLAVVMLIWGWRGMVGLDLAAAFLRAIALPVAASSLCLALASLPVPDAWPFPSSLGGFLGQYLQAAIYNLWPFGGMFWHAGLGLAAGVFGLGLLVVAIGIGWAEWRYYGRLLAAVTQLAIAWLRHGAALLRRRLGREQTVSPLLAEPQPQAKVELPKPPERKKRALIVDEKPKTKLPQFKQQSLDLGADDFQLPPLDFLKPPPKRGEPVQSMEAIENNTRLLEAALANYGVEGEVVRVRPGPVVTLYEMEPAPGTRAARVIGLADDIARNMSTVSARIAMVPGRSVLGIELPNQSRETIYLRELLESSLDSASQYHLPLILGKDIGGEPVIADLTRMPHLLIAGTTGSGKSVAINTMILSLLYRLPPDRCKLIMIDPKMLELSVYQDIPHLLTPVVTDPKKAIVALKWAVREMNNRYQAMSKLGVRNIEGYNLRLADARKKGEILVRSVQTGFDPETGRPVTEDQKLDLTPLPLIVVVVDEMADLMLAAGKDIEAAIQRLAQMARAAGIHLIMATQRPSVDVITGTIKANFPTRISFQVTSKIDSRTILGEAGAEQLLGQGDMLYMAGGGRITRVHGPYVSDAEVETIAKYLRDQGTPSYLDEVTADPEEDGALSAGGEGDGGDDLYRRALQIVLRDRKASTSYIQRHLAIGYNRAARIMDEMETRGIISPANATGKREILIESEDQLYG
jgi:DNA segregation ATPase FtsK/SpoIIIE, S-DNA-T family